MKNKIKEVVRAGWLIETNSSSSHALCICDEEEQYAKPGDPEFDLDIRDGVLYIPTRGESFGWEYEKTNSCQTKLQYVCALMFSQYQGLHLQKKPKKLVQILKRYLGVSKVVFAWEEEYLRRVEKEGYDEESEVYIDCPEIDHNSYSESSFDIEESPKTVIDFIFNKKSWLFGGNDNSDAPRGYYKEMKYEEKVDLDYCGGIVSGNFGSMGRIDFNVRLLCPIDGAIRNKHRQGQEILDMINESDSCRLLNNITYSVSAKDFELLDIRKHKNTRVLSPILSYYDKQDRPILVFLDDSRMLQDLKQLPDDSDDSIEKMLKDKVEGTDYVKVELKITSNVFGDLY